MTIKKDAAIRSVLEEFEKLANIVLEQLDTIENVIGTGEIALSDELIATLNEREMLIDKLEVKLSDKIVNTIVLQSPVASELRKLMSCYRTLINMERIGDRVINIVGFIGKIKKEDLYYSFQEVYSNSIIHAANMVRKALLAFKNDDPELAVWTIKNDDVMDEINGKLMKKLVKKADGEEANKKLLVTIVTMKEMMSNIERIADYATNIAEAAIYAIEGKDIRHTNLEE